MADDLLKAVEQGDLGRAESLLRQGASPDEDAWGMSLVDEALVRHDEQMTRLLVEYGARLHDVDARGQTRLHRAASASDEAEGVALLVRLGLDPNVAENDGWTPLHHAAAQGHREVVAVLLGAGAESEVLSVRGERPADLAAVNGHAGLSL